MGDAHPHLPLVGNASYMSVKGLVAVLAYLMFPVLFLLSVQQGSHTPQLIPKLGNNLREVVECKFRFFHISSGKSVKK